MTISGRLRLFIVLFFALIFSFLAVKNVSAGPSDCKAPNTLNCCAKDQRGELVDSSCAGLDRYRWYSCEKPTSTVQSCSDVCWVTNGVRGQCLADCPTNVGPVKGGFAKQVCCGAGCSFTPASIGPTITLGIPGSVSPTGLISNPFINYPGLTISQLFAQMNLNGTWPTWLTQFWDNLPNISLGTVPTKTPSGPTPTLSAIVTPIPLHSSATDCLVPASINTWSPILDPVFTSQEHNPSKRCSTNSLVSINTASYAYRECATDDSGQSYCYYDCFDLTKNKRVDCHGANLANLYFSTDNGNPKRTILRLVNVLNNDVQLLNNDGNGSIIIQKSNPIKTFFDPNSITRIAFKDGPMIKKIDRRFSPTSPDTNTLTVDLTNTEVNCGILDYDKLRITVTYLDSINIPHTIEKDFTCQPYFTALIELNQ